MIQPTAHENSGWFLFPAEFGSYGTHSDSITYISSPVRTLAGDRRVCRGRLRTSLNPNQWLGDYPATSSARWLNQNDREQEGPVSGVVFGAYCLERDGFTVTDARCNSFTHHLIWCWRTADLFLSPAGIRAAEKIIQFTSYGRHMHTYLESP